MSKPYCDAWNRVGLMNSYDSVMFYRMNLLAVHEIVIARMADLEADAVRAAAAALAVGTEDVVRKTRSVVILPARVPARVLTASAAEVVPSAEAEAEAQVVVRAQLDLAVHLQPNALALNLARLLPMLALALVLRLARDLQLLRKLCVALSPCWNSLSYSFSIGSAFSFSKGWVGKNNFFSLY